MDFLAISNRFHFKRQYGRPTLTETGYNVPSPDKTIRFNTVYRTRGSSLPDIVETTRDRLLNKQIRSNDPNKILGGSYLGASYGRGDIEVTEAEKKEIVENILNMRRKLDETRETYVYKEQELNKMKAEIDKMKNDEEFCVGSAYKGRSRLEQLKNSLDVQKMKLDEAMHTNKTFEGMLDRLKKDKLNDKVRYTKVERDISRGRTYLEKETKEAKQAKDFTLRTRSVFSRMIRRVEEEDTKRQESLMLFEKAVLSREEAERNRQERIFKTDNLYDTLSKEMARTSDKKQRSLMLVHKFVNVFMKRRMEAEMRKHEREEQAFQRIKASTGIADAQQFIEKFVKKEETYSNLLMSISKMEKEAEQGRKLNEQLKRKADLLKEKNIAFEKEKADKKDDNEYVDETYKEFVAQNEISKIAKTKIEQSYAWAIKALIKMDKAQGVPVGRYTEMFSKEKTSAAILQVFSVVSKHLKTIKETDENYGKVLYEIGKTKIDEEIEKDAFLAKNVRVKMDQTLATMSQTGRSSSRLSNTFSNSQLGTPYDMSPDSKVAGKGAHNNKDEDDDDDDTEAYFNAQRKAVRTKYAKALVQRKLQEKLDKLNNVGK